MYERKRVRKRFCYVSVLNMSWRSKVLHLPYSICMSSFHSLGALMWSFAYLFIHSFMSLSVVGTRTSFCDLYSPSPTSVMHQLLKRILGIFFRANINYPSSGVNFNCSVLPFDYTQSIWNKEHIWFYAYFVNIGTAIYWIFIYSMAI